MKALRVLILGGTGFIGPHYVRAAHKRGHSVAVFNRGKGAADFPQTVERLVGDRNGPLEAIQNRDWDAVIDLAAYVPSSVRSLGEALKHRVKHYKKQPTDPVITDWSSYLEREKALLAAWQAQQTVKEGLR